MQKGKVIALFIAPNTDDAVQSQNTIHLAPNQGIVGDRYFVAQQSLGIDTQAPRKEDITLISADELEAFNTQFELDIPLGDFRRNIVTRGVDLNALVGKRFRVGSALCIGMELCEPCSKLARTVNKLVLPHLVHRAGIRAAVLNAGDVLENDSIEELSAEIG